MTGVRFSFHRVRFSIGVDARLQFPSPLPANLLRGALGSVLMRRPAEYARIFAPVSEHGPSGLTQRPRPFVFRAAHLAGRIIEPEGDFGFDVHVFDAQLVEVLIDALAEAIHDGLGPERSAVVLLGFHRERIECAMEPTPTVTQVSVEFATPTELKQEGRLVEEPPFAVLLSLARTRLLNLSRFYGEAALGDLASGWRERAELVDTVYSDLRHIAATRFSTHTHQLHPLGGFTGTVRYEGDLSEFFPYLRAAQYTGVGRQTSWGKGELRLLYDHSS